MAKASVSIAQVSAFPPPSQRRYSEPLLQFALPLKSKPPGVASQSSQSLRDDMLADWGNVTSRRSENLLVMGSCRIAIVGNFVEEINGSALVSKASCLRMNCHPVLNMCRSTTTQFV